MRKSLVFVAMVACLSLALTSCQWSEDRFLDRAVSTEELVGSWTLTPAGVRDLRSSGIESEARRSLHVIRLDGDGSCEFNTFLPSEIRADRPPRVVSSSCTWELSEGRRQSLSIELPGADSRATYHFSDEGELLIWQYIGDPDAWRYVEYSKAEGFQTSS